MFLRVLNPQGLAGLAAALILSLLLAAAKIDARHFRKQSDRFERLYRAEVEARAQAIASYRAAAEEARRADRANVERVRARQSSINERTADDFEARLASARARAAQRLRADGAPAIAFSRPRTASVPGIPVAAGPIAETAGAGGLSPSERLLATEQAIQLDELISWVRAQAAINPASAEGE